ncbi:MAG: hypothetical protein RBR70_12745 [Arcobacter sp.]|jgi:hypothetical protein|uniref:hypothetical protein n=1 Tax=Arcobacter sp. TaxID=1872629 RepID=UPI002A74FE60|nr:hypothetical protein [Arcobacter sp.]MDY3205931.1 hypothetical protein [Arcobacter sp.]
MEKEILRNCEIITKMNQETQNQMIRTFTKLDISVKVDVFKEQKVIFHKLKNIHFITDNSILTYASFVLAVEVVIKNTNQVNLKAIKLRTKNAKKQNQKREKLLSYWSVIKTLKNEQNYSFREISDYLRKYHRLEVSYSLVYQTWNEIEIINLNKEN